jgi:DNA-binding transcriptional LysR family regulator
VWRWIDKTIPRDRIVFRGDSFVALYEAAAAGMGVAALPCYLADPSRRLVRLRAAPVAELATELWILTHPDLRGTARIRALTDHLAAALVGDRALLEGGGIP